MDGNKLTEKQVKIIKDHLSLVFTKVTPDRSKPAFDEKAFEKALKDLKEKEAKESKSWAGGITGTGTGQVFC